MRDKLIEVIRPLLATRFDKSTSDMAEEIADNILSRLEIDTEKVLAIMERKLLHSSDCKARDRRGFMMYLNKCNCGIGKTATALSKAEGIIKIGEKY